MAHHRQPGGRARGGRPKHSGKFKLPGIENTGIAPAMEKLFSDPHYKGFVLQDKKRLPARFFARVCGATTSRLG